MQLEIIINGIKLNYGQATTIHVALQSLAADLEKNGLGDDEHGKIMTEAYLARIQEITDTYLPKN